MVNYKTDSIRYQKLIPKQENLDKHILLGQIYEKVDPLISYSEAHIKYQINNSIPVLCAIEGTKLMVVSALNKADSNKTRKINNLASFIKNRTITSNELPVMYIVVTPKFPKQLILHDFNYLPWPIAPLILQNLNKDINHYIRSFQQSFFKTGYLHLANNGHFWQVSKNGQTYNLAELITGSSELMRVLTNPPPNTYVYIISRAHLYNVTMGYGSFLVYSAKDKTTYRVIPKPGGKHHFEKVKDGIIV